MFDSLNDQTLRAAHDAARVLYDNHRALGLDVLVISSLSPCVFDV